MQSKHIKGSKECYLSGQKHNLQVFGGNPLLSSCKTKISGLKCAHIRACRQYNYLMVLYQICFQYYTFWQKSFHVLARRGKKAFMISNLALLLVVFRVTARQAYGSKRVNHSLAGKLFLSRSVSVPEKRHLTFDSAFFFWGVFLH